MPDETSLPLISFSLKKKISNFQPHLCKEDMATRNVASSLLKKKSRSLQRRSSNSGTVSSTQSTGVVTRSMTKATAATNAKRTVAVAPLHSIDDTDSNMNDGVSKSLLADPLKGKSTSTLKIKQQSPFFGMEDYYSSDFFCVAAKKDSLSTI